jgi:hypothetical protein
MRAVEIISQNHWNNIWIETDSSLVVLASKSSNHVPWHLRNRWNNVKVLLLSLHCIVSHVYKEGNQMADSLATHGLYLSSISFWHDVPDFIRPAFLVTKKVGLTLDYFLSGKRSIGHVINQLIYGFLV